VPVFKIIRYHLTFKYNSFIYSIVPDFKNAINKTNSRALVRQRTIPTERPPLVGEVSANFSG
jgi:hypothetical protein